jgi:hypothetical protein
LDGGGKANASQPACADLFHASSGQMQLVDVGMTSMVISEVSENYNSSLPL